MSKFSWQKISIISLHVLAWTLLLVYPFWVLPRSPLMIRAHGPEPMDPGAGPPGFSLDPSLMQIESVITTILLALFFYLNIYVLIPKFLSKNNWFLYGTLILTSLMLFLLTGYGIRLLIFPFNNFFKPPFFIGVPNFFMAFGISLSVRFMQDRYRIENNLKEKETERLKSELSFLRSQVSPHFIFNVLNGVAALARKKSDKIEESILQLSHLMRYSLYTNEQRVTVEKEAEYIENYINLQKLRFGNKVAITFEQTMLRKDILIEPMLLIPFVENAFKHGVGLMDQPVIIIKLAVTDHQLSFEVKNRFNAVQPETKDSSSGIGLQNVKRRLELLYPDLYTLDIRTEENWFITELKMTVS